MSCGPSRGAPARRPSGSLENRCGATPRSPCALPDLVPSGCCKYGLGSRKSCLGLGETLTTLSEGVLCRIDGGLLREVADPRPPTSPAAPEPDTGRNADLDLPALLSLQDRPLDTRLVSAYLRRYPFVPDG